MRRFFSLHFTLPEYIYLTHFLYQLEYQHASVAEERRLKAQALEQTMRTQREFEMEQQRLQQQRDRKLEAERHLNEEQMASVRQRREIERSQRIAEERVQMDRSRCVLN
jgi:hypothetical protein